MSLDVSLQIRKGKVKRKIKSIIYEGNNGEDQKIHSWELEDYFPNKDESYFEFEEEDIDYVYSANITHNLNKMATACGLYEALWRPYQLHKSYSDFGDDYNMEMQFEGDVIILAKDIIPIIEKGLIELKARPNHYKEFNSSNGWGMYKHFLPFVQQYLEACKSFPESYVIASR